MRSTARTEIQRILARTVEEPRSTATMTNLLWQAARYSGSTEAEALDAYLQLRREGAMREFEHDGIVYVQGSAAADEQLSLFG